MALFVGIIVPAGRKNFHALWEEIHDPARRWTPEWWATVIDRLPVVRCDCQRHAREYAKANPIPFGDDEACWAWGVELHNAVSTRLGKPTMTAEAARAKWSTVAP